MKKTALVIRHQSSVHLGSFADVLTRNQYDIRHHNSFEDDITKVDPLEYDIVIVLGGIMGVYNRDEYPYLKDEITFLERRIAADRPTLGVCLGSQMIAAALGADVYPGKQGFELCWTDLKLSKAGENSPVRHFDPSCTKMFISHGDTFDLPEGAVLLASSDQYPHQAYSYGENTLAVQFHPEINAGLAEELLMMLVGKLSGNNTHFDVHDIRAQTKENIGTLQTQTAKFLGEWLEHVDAQTIRQKAS